MILWLIVFILLHNKDKSRFFYLPNLFRRVNIEYLFKIYSKNILNI